MFLVEWPGKGSDVDKVERSDDSLGGTGDSWPGRAGPANGPKGRAGALSCDTKMTLPLGKRPSCPVTGIQTTSLCGKEKASSPFGRKRNASFPTRAAWTQTRPHPEGSGFPGFCTPDPAPGSVPKHLLPTSI